MKVLFISNYYDGTGYGHAAIDYILALDAAGVDVVCRSITFNNARCEVPQRILELESKDIGGCDICIQYTLPHFMDFNGKFKKNVALYDSETSNFSDSTWASSLNCMDEILVVNEQMRDAADASGVIKPITVIGHPCNVEKFEQSYPRLKYFDKYKDDFIFYFIGEMNVRKNITGLIKAFHSEFKCYENVQLCLKVNQPGKSAEETRIGLEELCSKMKKEMKMHGGDLDKFKKEIIITERLSEEEIYSLHTSCDCFVTSSLGEAWSIPAFDAMGFGKTPIAPNWGGFTEYLDDEVGQLVNGHDEMVFGVNDSLEDLYTSNEYWYKPNTYDLAKSMRKAFERDKDVRKQMANNGLSRAYDFSYENIGKSIRQAIS